LNAARASEALAYDLRVSTLPQGTVTFVFTDVEGSTELLKELGEGYREVLSQHRQIVRETFTPGGGVEMDTQGDAFFFVFARARDAVSAAVGVQRAHTAAEWPGGATVRVRIGLHTGEPALHEEGYLGLDVVRAARICTVGRGGQVLLSETTRALVGSALPEGVGVFPLGERHLRGLDEPERVYELAIDEPEPEVEEAKAPVPAPAEAEPPARFERDLEKRFGDLGARLAAVIEDRVFSSLEWKSRKGESPAPDETSDVDELAARAESLGDRISAQVEAALRARGIEPKQEE
jgi:class 3 adenylate cyclase